MKNLPVIHLRRETYLSASRVKNGSKNSKKREKTKCEHRENQLNTKTSKSGYKSLSLRNFAASC